MRSLADLCSADSAWPGIQTWISAAKVPVAVLPAASARAEQVLLALQITTHSPMGALALETGGILVDGGWLRFLGGGGKDMAGDLARWNGLQGPCPLNPPPHGFMVVAHDVLGGFFAIDGGGLGDGRGSVFYFAPDTLDWEDLGFGYSALLAAALQDLVPSFYAESRWPGWETEVAMLSPDHGLSISPPLSSRESAPIAKAYRRAVSMGELWALEQQWADQLGDVPDGSQVKVTPTE